MSADDTYAPKSPDLSSFYSGGPTEPVPQQLHHLQPAGSHLALEYKTDPSAYSHLSPPTSYAPPPVHLNNHTQPHYHPQPQHPPPPQQAPIKAEYQNYSPHLQQQYLPSGLNHGLPPHPGYGTHLAPTSHQHHAQPPFGSPYGEQNLLLGIATHHTQPYAPAFSSDTLPHPPNAILPPHSLDMPPRKAAPPPAPIIEPSPVKTKFPTARIKRIMQADEEVGKVAQQTPIAVGKALELFMIQLVSKSADVAKDKGSKRVTASMLKHVVETDEQWDFLRDIVGRVENEKEGSKAKAKAESSSDEEVPEPKKRTRGGGRKKKA